MDYVYQNMLLYKMNVQQNVMMLHRLQAGVRDDNTQL